MQYLDSLAVDGDGWVCVATLFNGGITAISPDGSRIEHHATGDLITTNVCFGGDDMKTLFITTTRENMDEAETAQYPLSGAIFTLPVSVAGMKKSRFIER